ncbi:hypothetical protein ACP275_02G078700 [Erythranthe tilingii]
MHARCLGKGPREEKMADWLKGTVIGSGSFGTVHLAVDTSTGALFVAKSAKTEAGIMSLKNEAEILENLDSPYIVKCIGKDVSFTKNGETNYNLFFEYMAGGSLSDLSQKFGGSLDERLIRLYTREILQGLTYLHKNGIVHSDIKCKNVLVDSLGAIKVADFGCAKRLSDKKSRKSCVIGIGGTPLWMAPEVVRNEGLDFAADIWSLGCTIIEMATGRPPWGGDAANPMAALLKIANGNEIPEFPRHFSSEGLDFLSKCLQRDPRKRWTSEELLRHPFITRKASFVSNSRKGLSFSPTSVVDFASYESDDSYSSDDDEFVVDKMIPFTAKKLMPKYESENVFEASDDWITVRSR